MFFFQKNCYIWLWAHQDMCVSVGWLWGSLVFVACRQERFSSLDNQLHYNIVPWYWDWCPCWCKYSYMWCLWFEILCSISICCCLWFETLWDTCLKFLLLLSFSTIYLILCRIPFFPSYCAGFWVGGYIYKTQYVWWNV